MVLNSFKTLLEAGLALEKLRNEFGVRLMVLTVANIQSIAGRILRLSTLCGEVTSSPDFIRPGSQGIAQIADMQAKYLSRCGDAYVKEARNLVQAAFLTQSELMDWTDRLLIGWSNLAPEFEQATLSDATEVAVDQGPPWLRPEAMRMRNALSFMKPSASF